MNEVVVAYKEEEAAADQLPPIPSSKRNLNSGTGKNTSGTLRPEASAFLN